MVEHRASAVTRQMPRRHTLCPTCDGRIPHEASSLGLCATCLRATYQDARAYVEQSADAGRETMKLHRAEHDGTVREGQAKTGKPGYLYFAKRGSLVKIGWSQNPQQRLKQIGGEALLATIPGYLHDELVLHKRFDLLRVDGEWFAYTPALARYITDLASEAA